MSTTFVRENAVDISLTNSRNLRLECYDFDDNVETYFAYHEGGFYVICKRHVKIR